MVSAPAPLGWTHLHTEATAFDLRLGCVSTHARHAAAPSLFTHAASARAASSVGGQFSSAGTERGVRAFRSWRDLEAREMEGEDTER